MVQITSYVFMDLETSGLPSEEHNKTKITELSMVAVTREHILNTTPGLCPRVLDKLTLCFNPRKMISPGSTNITGLDNYLLEHKATFNADVGNMINTFLKILPQPVCIMAYNGMGFDFPIFKNHFEKLNMSLVQDVWCADCYHGYYDILETKRKLDMQNLSTNLTSNILPDCMLKEQLDNGALKENIVDNDRSVNLEFSKISTELDEVTSKVENKSEDGQEVTKIQESDNLLGETYSLKLSAIDKTDDTEWKRIKMSNETTPKQTIRQTTPVTPQKAVLHVNKARRRLPYSRDKKPKESYKLLSVYERIMNKAPKEAHRAECDCIYALEIAVVLGKDFILWVDNNCCLFSDIKSMTLGTRIGF